MASNRLLIFKSNLLYFFVAGLLFLGCTATEKTIEDVAELYVEEETSNINSGKEKESSYLDEYSNQLSDLYSTQTNQTPEVFAEIKVRNVTIDSTQGFRIQIYSGQKLDAADNIAAEFRAWSDSVIVGYQAETYTFFKTPYYRVHVGDFSDKDKALRYSNLVKRQFKDAWVVYDKINFQYNPSDTLIITAR